MARKKKSTKTVAKKVVSRRPAIALNVPQRTLRHRAVLQRVPAPEPKVDTIVTETDIVTEPKVEIRRAATLAQALTEPAVAVVKPETKVVRRVVKKTKRAKRAA